MSAALTISIDAMGGDDAPAAVVEGVARAARRGDGAHYLLHGYESEIAPLLEQHPEAAKVCEIRHSDTWVTMTDKPSEALRRARGSSMWNAVESVKHGEANVAVSAGNTGALMAISKIVLRMKKGVHRPAIAASWPNPKGYSVVLDVGANIEVEETQLVEFAIMGEAFCRAVHGAKRPTVGLLNVGAEEMKGNSIVQGAAKLLQEAHLDLDYYGYVEGNDISAGVVDVVVTDGFTGNVALKTAEGTAKLVGGFIREGLTSSVMSRLGALMARGGLNVVRQRMDPRNVNGGVFLGLNGIVVKSHGGTDGQGFAQALNVALDMAKSSYLSEIEKNLARLERVDVEDALAAPETVN